MEFFYAACEVLVQSGVILGLLWAANKVARGLGK